MSKEYGARCLDCNTRSGECFNHGEEVVKEMIAVAPLIKDVFDRVKCGIIEFRWIGDYDDVFEFVTEHIGHRVEPVSEYD